jgi:hypothetical protein
MLAQWEIHILQHLRNCPEGQSRWQIGVRLKVLLNLQGFGYIARTGKGTGALWKITDAGLTAIKK